MEENHNNVYKCAYLVANTPERKIVSERMLQQYNLSIETP